MGFSKYAPYTAVEHLEIWMCYGIVEAKLFMAVGVQEMGA